MRKNRIDRDCYYKVSPDWAWNMVSGETQTGFSWNREWGKTWTGFHQNTECGENPDWVGTHSWSGYKMMGFDPGLLY